MDQLAQNNPLRIPAGCPVIAICGFSNSGKTTLIERLIARLSKDELHVATIKHYSHDFSLDYAGKDTDRFFQAGATVFGQDARQRFIRQHLTSNESLTAGILRLSMNHDVVLVEGYKHIDLPVKIWLRRRMDDSPPEEIGDVAADLNMDQERLEPAMDVVWAEIHQQFVKRPTYGGIVIDQHVHCEKISLLSELLQAKVSEMKPYVSSITVFSTSSPLLMKICPPEVLLCTVRNDCTQKSISAALRSHPGSSWLFSKLSEKIAGSRNDPDSFK